MPRAGARLPTRRSARPTSPSRSSTGRSRPPTRRCPTTRTCATSRLGVYARLPGQPVDRVQPRLYERPEPVAEPDLLRHAQRLLERPARLLELVVAALLQAVVAHDDELLD